MTIKHWLVLASFFVLFGITYALGGPFIAVLVFWGVVLASMLPLGKSADRQPAVELQNNSSQRADAHLKM